MTEAEKREKNIKLYPIYKMFSWDLLFYYAILFLFITQEKGLTVSDILLADAFYPLAKLALQIPCVIIVDKLEKVKSIIIGNIAIALGLLFLILGNGLFTLIIFNIIIAFGFNLKSLCESSILYDSIVDSDDKLDVFSKYDGRGTSFHYFIDAVSSITTGFLFVINPYFPIICCLLFVCISIFISFKFYDFETISAPKNISYNYLRELKSIFKFIIHSNRLKGLLFFSAIFTALLSILSTLKTSILVEIEIPEIYFGIIIACIQFISGIACKKHLIINKMFKNKTLAFLSLGCSLSLILGGLVVFCDFSFAPIVVTLGFWFFFYSIAKGTYYPIIKRYLNSFSIPIVNTKIYATQTVFDSIARIPASLLASYILSVTNTSTSFVIIGLVFSIIFIFLLDYMNNRVGLQPEEYDKKDIYYYETALR